MVLACFVCMRGLGGKKGVYVWIKRFAPAGVYWSTEVLRLVSLFRDVSTLAFLREKVSLRDFVTKRGSSVS